MKLEHLSDEQLLNDTLFWTDNERQSMAKVLWHLKEIDLRRLYTLRKCSSLYDFCLKILKFSEGEAARRVSASRLLIQLPQISKDIENGNLGLTQLNLVRQFFKEENIKSPKEKLAILDQVKNKTTRETERILWELKKIEGPRKVTLKLNEETVMELKKLKDLKAHSCPDMDTLLLKMCAVVGKVWDPTVVHRHRKVTDGDTRYIQVQVKAAVWERDKGQCVNCGSTRMLELDHIIPYAVGGKSTVENLQLLCWGCNQRKAMEFFGPVGPDPKLAVN